MIQGRCKALFYSGRLPGLGKLAATLQLALFHQEGQAWGAAQGQPALLALAYRSSALGLRQPRDRCHYLADYAWDWPLQLSPDCCCSARLLADVAPPASGSGAGGDA